MECRLGCGACCIAPGIHEPFAGMPQGKPAGKPRGEKGAMLKSLSKEEYERRMKALQAAMDDIEGP